MPVRAKFPALPACVIIFFATLEAQDKPDFSGRWVLQSRAPAEIDVPRTLIVRQSIARTNVRGEPMTPFFKTITIEREFATLTRVDTYDIGVLGGFVGGLAGHRIEDPDDRPHGSNGVEWVGKQLLFTSANYAGRTKESGPYNEHSELWSLEGRDKLMIRISGESSERGRRTLNLEYRRAR